MFHDLKQFLRRNSSVVILAVAIFTLIVLEVWVLFERSRMVSDAQLHERLETIAALAAESFTGEELDGIRNAEDLDTAQYFNLVQRLKRVKAADSYIEYAYIMRRTGDPMILEFVVDADALQSFEEIDANNNGIIDPDEELSYPGDEYAIDDVPALQNEAFIGPTSDEEVTVDQWGELISGYAPIYRKDGTVEAVVGVDMDASDFLALSRRTFTPIMLLLCIALALLIAGFIGVMLWQRKMMMVQVLDKERSSLLALTSHQLGAPVVSMKWWLEILQEGGSSKEEKEEAFAAMSGAVRRITDVVQDLREAEAAEQGGLSMEKKPISLYSIVRIAHERILLRLKDNDITIDIHCPKNIRVLADEKLIEGVFFELFDNALSFSSKGSTITLSTKKRDKYVEVSIHDEGCGVPKKEQERIFEKMTRASNAAIHKPDGNGLGLYIAKTIIEHAGGTMRLSSKEGEGSTFIFTLPIAK